MALPFQFHHVGLAVSSLIKASESYARFAAENRKDTSITVATYPIVTGIMLAANVITRFLPDKAHEGKMDQSLKAMTENIERLLKLTENETEVSRADTVHVGEGGAFVHRRVERRREKNGKE